MCKHANLGNRFRAIRAAARLNMQTSVTILALLNRSCGLECKSRESFSPHSSGRAFGHLNLGSRFSRRSSSHEFEHAHLGIRFRATRAVLRLKMQILGSVFAPFGRSRA